MLFVTIKYDRCARHVQDDSSAVCGLSLRLHVSVVLYYILFFVYGPSDVYMPSDIPVRFHKLIDYTFTALSFSTLDVI